MRAQKGHLDQLSCAHPSKLGIPPWIGHCKSSTPPPASSSTPPRTPLPPRSIFHIPASLVSPLCRVTTRQAGSSSPSDWGLPSILSSVQGASSQGSVDPECTWSRKLSVLSLRPGAWTFFLPKHLDCAGAARPRVNSGRLSLINKGIDQERRCRTGQGKPLVGGEHKLIQLSGTW